MKTEKINIYNGEKSENCVLVRTSCRAFIEKDGKILISHEKNNGHYLIPGGGLEGGEALEECCKREVLEETGYIIEPGECFLELNEYYGNRRFTAYYFTCKIQGRGETSFTEEEVKNGLVTEWMSPEEFVSIVSRYDEFSGVDEDKRDNYLREYTAFCKYTELKEQG